MTACAIHRLRYRRLWRLPVVRTIGITVAVAVAVVALTVVLAPLWTSLLVLAAGAGGLVVHLRRHRDRVAVEIKMIRDLWQASASCLGDVHVPGLGDEVRAETMPTGVTRIDASSWLDAVRALGFVMGHDRAFQLDLLRRTAKGSLAEVWGRNALPIDKVYRPLGLAEAVKKAAVALEAPERDLLTAFAAGVNAALRQGLPFECHFLSYRPERWTIEDSLVIALYLFHSLSWNEPSKRAEAAIRRTFPEPVAEFFLPGGGDLPPNLADFRKDEAADVIAVDRAVAGSNCWVTTGLAGPILACDPHLPLTMPNLLYEVDLSWAEKRVRGLAAPGLPVVLTGGNGRIVWGVTNLSADVLDLVPVDPANLTSSTERVKVRGRPDAELEVTWDGVRPVSTLLGEQVAYQWTGHDPRAADLKFQRLVHAGSVAESIKILEDADGIALNVLVADDSGRMAHLATGLSPTGDRPKLVDPPSGVLVSANDDVLPGIGYDLDPGYRARRIRQVLTTTRAADPAAMRELQHDAAADLYLPYRDLAVDALGAGTLADLLAAWDGKAGADSRAFTILVRLRDILAQRILSPYLSACREHDPAFQYPFRSIDRPLLAILRANELPASCVREAAEGATVWGAVNQVGMTHPLAGLAPWSAGLLGIAATPQSGALHSVRTCVPGFAAVGRSVLSPGPNGIAEFELPGGQSGHPLSRHFDDRHDQWASTVPRAGRRGSGCTFVLRGGRDD